MNTMLKRLGLAAAGAGLGLALWVAAGCETNSDVQKDEGNGEATDGGLGITPESVYLGAASTNEDSVVTNLVAFEAFGGSGFYQWSVADSNLGTLVANGARAFYTRKTTAGGNFVIVEDTEDTGNRASAEVIQE
jgi:hypothetical protein